MDITREEEYLHWHIQRKKRESIARLNTIRSRKAAENSSRETENRERIAGVIGRLLKLEGQE
jgi:hypothetical protein